MHAQSRNRTLDTAARQHARYGSTAARSIRQHGSTAAFDPVSM
ncbi:hypothetical protein I546_1548 [Mycobacterium kansasii 732]|nr:hypothetical protein I546_1548 [Mycobacterium kansasii 732]